jgi:Glycogen recognition site of AMP-activated protein kinase
MRASPPLALAALALALGAGASAQPALFGSAEVTVGAGHDTNMFLPVSLDAAMRQPRASGWFARGAPRLGGALAAGGWRLDGSYALDYRGSEVAGHLVEQRVELALTAPRLGRLQPALAAAAGRFDAGSYSEDRFVSVAGELSGRLEMSASLRASASYRIELRRYPNRTATSDPSDLLHLAELRLAYRPPPRVEIGLAAPCLLLDPVRASVADNGSLRFVRAGPEVEAVFRRLSLGVWGWGGSLARDGLAPLWQVGAGVGGVLRVGENLDAIATVDWTGSPWSGDPAAPDYARRYAALSLLAHATRRVTLARRDDPASLAPLSGVAGVRFRLRAPGATAVRVIGSWDDWEARGKPLAPTREPGLWEAWLELAPGQHRYRFVVDGQVVRPPDAPRYVPDDFGGEDAVLEVTARPEPALPGPP